MNKLVRLTTKQEELAIERCPCCNEEVEVGDCGYSTFNPGWAQCKGCKRKWSYQCVQDSWQVALLWNKRAIEIKRRLRLIAKLKPQPVLSVSRDFASEEESKEIDQLLFDFAEYVIGADKQKKPL